MFTSYSLCKKYLFFLDPNCIPSLYGAYGIVCGGRLLLELCIVVGGNDRRDNNVKIEAMKGMYT